MIFWLISSLCLHKHKLSLKKRGFPPKRFPVDDAAVRLGDTQLLFYIVEILLIKQQSLRQLSVSMKKIQILKKNHLSLKLNFSNSTENVLLLFPLETHFIKFKSILESRTVSTQVIPKEFGEIKIPPDTECGNPEFLLDFFFFFSGATDLGGPVCLSWQCSLKHQACKNH